jgi:dUTPase
MLVYTGSRTDYRLEYATECSVGVDLINDGEDVVIGTIPVMIDTGVKLTPVARCMNGYIRIAPKSGKALGGLQVLAGVVDLDYPSTIKVILVNYTHPVKIKSGEKVAQAIWENCNQIRELPIKQPLRTGGFGSTDGKDGSQ